MMRFMRTLSVKHHPTGDHYVMAVPEEIAHILDLQDGGLCSIELVPNVPKSHTHKKKAGAQAILKAYKNTEPATSEIFDPDRISTTNLFVDMLIKPRTRGPSKPWGQGRVFDPGVIQELRSARRWVMAEFRRVFPRRRRRRR
jgi:hypothetical protein